MHKILFVSSDRQFLETLRSYFEDQYQILVGQNNSAALSIIEASNPDVIISKYTLKDETHIFRKNSDAGLIFIFENATDETEKKMFAAGGDYYVVLPFELDALHWKIKAVLRRKNSTPKQPTMLTIGKIEIDLVNHTVFSNKTARLVTPLQFALLVAFAKHPDRLLSRTWFKDNVWRGERVSSRTIDAHISKLKKQVPEICDFLTNVYGEGYLYSTKSRAA